jgi:4-amino-4-deoxy-L-arabinose transferase-like glycosyltransferase
MNPEPWRKGADPNLGATVSPSNSKAQFAAEDWLFTFALALVALAPRLFVSIVFSREPVWDAHYYHFGAERIAGGFGYSADVEVLGRLVQKPWTHYPVGYSAFLGAVYALFGSGPLVGPVLGAMIGTALTIVVHRLSRLFLSKNRARVAGTLTALHPGLIAYSALLMTEPLAALLVLCALLARFSVVRETALRIATGIFMGLGALVRPLSLGLWLALMLAERPLSKRSFARVFMIGVCAVLTILPWTLRNCRVMDGCALISTNGGWNLAIGAITKTGRFEALRAEDGCPVVTGQVQQDRCWAAVGRRKIAEDPAGWLQLVPKKLSQTYDHESFPIEYLHEAAPELWPEGRRARGRTLLTAYHWMLIVMAALSAIAWPFASAGRSTRLVQAAGLGGLALLGAYCLRNELHPFFVIVAIFPMLGFLPLPGRPETPPLLRALWALVFLTSLSHAVFFGEDRYHIVITPVLCILAAAALRAPSSPDLDEFT